MILITGATGNNGLEIVKLLSQRGVPCRALVRTSEKSGVLANYSGVQVVFGDFAAVAAAVLTDSGHAGKSYVITGPESLTYTEIADRLSAAVGTKIVYVDVPLEQARKAMADSGAPEWYVDGQMEQFQVRLKGYQAAVTTVVSEVAKKEPISFDQFARDHAAYFRGDPATSAASAP